MKKAFLTTFVFLSFITVYSQVLEEWVAVYDGPENLYEHATDITVDNNGNVYVTGESYSNVSNMNYATVKYNSAGVQQWAKIYNGTGNSGDYPVSMVIDNLGNVYVTGYSYGIGTSNDYTTVKYSSAGVEQWVRRYNSGFGILEDKPVAIALDASGNVYVTGNSIGNGTGFDYATVKYNSAGVEQWVQRYNRTGTSFNVEQATSMAVDSEGNVYVTGKSNFSTNYYDYATVKYNSSGAQQWVSIYHAPGNLNYSGIANAIAVDDAGNVYVTGESQFSSFNNDYATVKYNSSGVQQWAEIYNGLGNNADRAQSIVVDNLSNVYVTGTSYNFTSYDYTTIKYNPSGLQQWAKIYNEAGNGNDFATSVDVDAGGNVYVTGESADSGSGLDADDYATIKYDSSGNEKWVTRFDGGGHMRDIGIAIITNDVGNVYVTGESYTSSTNRDFVTIKYSQGLTITNPIASEKWMAGETDTIKWTGGHAGQHVSVEYSTDNGQTYNLIALSTPADSQYYVWTIPNNLLSTKAKIKLSDFQTTTQLALSDSFRIKPYIITKLDANGNYIAYNINMDKWGFSNIDPDVWPRTWFQQFNYRGIDPFTNQQYPQDGLIAFKVAPDSIHPDWVSWVNTFGVVNCYFDLGASVYHPNAIIKWQYANTVWKGSCFGIAISNALAFYKKNEFFIRYPGFPVFTNPISVTANDSVRKVINELFSHQYGNPHRTYRTNVGLNKTPNQTLTDLKAMLKEDSVKIRTLSLVSNNGSGGHAILGYKLENDPSSSSKFRVYVYDNSNPDSLGAFVEIDTVQNKWKTYYDWTTWGGSKWLYLRDPAENYLSNDLFPRQSENQSPFILEDSTLQVFLDNAESISISNLVGESLGYSNGVLVAEIPNSFPFIVENGSEGPPLGYELVSDNYSVFLNNLVSDTFSVAFFNSNKSFVYEREGADSTQTDRLFFDGGVSAVNPDQQIKSVSLLSIVNETTQEKVFFINKVELSQADSVKIINPDDNTLDLISYGSAKEYQIELNLASQLGLGRFQNDNILLSQNTTHKLVPDWGDFNNLQLTIYVDVGNDGTVDDTLQVQNQLNNTTTFQLAVSVNNSWNMVSIPGLHPIDQNVNTWWSGKDPAANVFKYSTGYQAITTATPGEGYWMKHLGANTYNTGDEWPAGGIQIVAHNPISGNAGWNLIGGYENSVATSGITTNPPGLISGPVYKYSSGYSVATTLDPGYGYWVKLTGAGQINIPAALAKNTGGEVKYFKEDWGRIKITDNTSRSYTLYAVNGEVDLGQYELPPAPPSGMFDVRFESGRIAENLNSSVQTIDMSGIEYPVRVKVENMNIGVRDETGMQINLNVGPGEEIVISDVSISKLKVSGDLVPNKYVLEQNYPNPFNPVTTIKYSLAHSGNVTLKVYDILGSEVATLVNEEKPAGVYSVNFDASQFASGMYLYRLQAGSFVQTKKMLMLK